MFRLDPVYLGEIADTYRQAYAMARPFPHVVIDNFLPESVLDGVLAEFPTAGASNWQRFENPEEKKLATSLERMMGDNTLLLLYELNSSAFLRFLESLTDIDGLIPDPHFVGGGLHQIERGGFLKVHADFNWHEELRLDRRLNFILYLNRDWREEYGGQLELWDQDMTHCEERILPIFNRCVVFNTTDTSYHGHPDPLTCPPGQTRKSLALYYYTNGRPAGEASGTHSSVFLARPGEQLPQAKPAWNTRVMIRKFSPPIVVDAVRYIKRRRQSNNS